MSAELPSRSGPCSFGLTAGSDGKKPTLTLRSSQVPGGPLDPSDTAAGRSPVSGAGGSRPGRKSGSTATPDRGGAPVRSSRKPLFFPVSRGRAPRSGKNNLFSGPRTSVSEGKSSGDGKKARLRFTPTQEKLLYERQASEVPCSSDNAMASVSSLAAAASPSQGSGTSRAAARQRRRHRAANERVPRCDFRRGDGLSAGGRTPFVLSPSKDT